MGDEIELLFILCVVVVAIVIVVCGACVCYLSHENAVLHSNMVVGGGFPDRRSGGKRCTSKATFTKVQNATEPAGSYGPHEESPLGSPRGSYCGKSNNTNTRPQLSKMYVMSPRPGQLQSPSNNLQSQISTRGNHGNRGTPIKIPHIKKVTTNQWHYSLDANGKYHAKTNDMGASLLCDLWELTKLAMASYKLKPNQMKKGEKMYRNHTKGAYMHTWPEKHYSSPEFCWAYIKYKAQQRYPEVHNLLTKANISVGANPTVLLLGGGPGFEAAAIRQVLGPCRVINVDKSTMLGKASQFYHSEFQQMDFNSKSIGRLASECDLAVSSFSIRYIKPHVVRQVVDNLKSGIMLVNHGCPNDERVLTGIKKEGLLLRSVHGGSWTQFIVSVHDHHRPVVQDVVFPGIPYR